MFAVRIEGVEALSKRLEGLRQDVKYKGGRAALRKAANVVRDAARAGARNLDDADTGRSIASNIDVRWNGKLFKASGDLGFRVGVLKGAVLPRRGQTPDFNAGAPTPHWRLIEFGTQKMRAQPFMRPALERNLEKVAATFVVEYGKSIDRQLRKAAQ